MKRTTKYQLGYYEEGDRTDGIVEMQRWETLDAQLYAVYEVLGNGVISGWDILPSSGLSIVVAAGSGHVNFISVESTENTLVGDLTPNATNYIFASLTTTSYWDKTVSFVSFLSSDNHDEYLYLGSVLTNSTSIISVDITGRVYLGFVNLIQSLVEAHRHIGGSDNPPPVNLASEVQGIINQANMPDLDASIIQTGTLDSDRLPLIDHITQLINQGTLTHAQLDSFVETLSLTNPTLMGETSTIDLLQLILALKHVYPDIDKYLVNEIAYIPGISPDSYVDQVNTTAVVDYRPSSEGGLHTITGLPAPAKKAYTYTWDSDGEFETGTYSDVVIDGNVELATQENTLVIDEFGNLSEWSVITNDLSSASISLAADPSTFVVPPNSAKLVVGDQTVEIALLIKKEFDARDWSAYGKIVFYLKTESVQHGDIYFYLNDDIAGTQNSHIKVLDRNEPTLNVDTLQNGWQEVVVDISSYTRTNINTIGFYVSSQDGWDTSKGFDLNIDNIYLDSGVIYKESGYIREIFGGDVFYDFWRVRWDCVVPSSAGLEFKVRTRVGNTLSDLSSAVWSAYSSASGFDISLPAPSLYKYIEIECYFGSSTDYTRTAILKKLFLDFYSADVDGSFNYDTDDDFNSGDNFNILVSSNTMSISNTGEINDIFYGSVGQAVQLDDNLVSLYNITGSMLPRSTYQVLNSISPSLGLVSGVSRGNEGNLWLADLDNDRVIEVDKSGALVTGFYGSFLSAPVDNYGVEDSGPGSNIVETANTTTTSTTTLAVGTSLGILQAVYNSGVGVLYIVFNSDLENIYASTSKLDMDRIYVKIGTQRFYLNDSTVELLGVEEVKYNDWNALNSSSDVSAEFIGQFSFASHVLKITLNGANRTLLNQMVNTLAFSLTILSPYEQEQTSPFVTVNFLTYNFDLGSGNGIQVTLDSGVPQIIYTNTVTFNNLTTGKHTVVAQLISDGVLETNIEASAVSHFIVYSGTYSLPYVSINSPKGNQIYSGSPVVIDFDIANFPIISTGQHLRYVIDSGSPIDYYSEDSISISDLSSGKHSIRLYLVDKWGNELTGATYLYGSCTGTFIVGLNSKAVTKLYVNSGAIYNSTLAFTNNSLRVNVDVGNIYFCNIYSPVDVSVIPCETSAVNLSGLPTVLVAKLRSQSWCNGLASTAYATEFNNRLIASANSASNVTSSVLSSIPTSELIYGTKYLDGHSVVQMNLSGEVVFSNNAAIFSDNKEDAKVLLGSAEKLGDNELLIGDSYNQRAIITTADLSTQESQIEWQYDSDRYIPDFHIVLQDSVTISILNDSISPSSVYIRQGTTVIWENNSSGPVTVISGTTTYDQFQLDPDLTLYGDIFESQSIQPGDRYSHKFVSVGEFNWFVYPDILTASISVTRNRISSPDQFLILESDGLSSPFSSRVIRVDCYGNISWSFGSGYICQPRDARPLLSSKVMIST